MFKAGAAPAGNAMPMAMNHCKCVLTGGTGAGQAQFVDSYVGATRVATMAANWAVAPDATTTFVLLPLGTIPGATAPTAAQVADAVHDEPRADHVAAGTMGEALNRAHAHAHNRKVVNASDATVEVFEDDAVTVAFTKTTTAGPASDEVQVDPS